MVRSILFQNSVDRELGGEELAVFLSVPEFAFPAAGGINFLPHGMVKKTVVPVGFQDAQIPAYHLVILVAGYVFERRVDGNDISVGIGDHHRLAAVPVHHRRQLYLHFRFLALGDIHVKGDAFGKAVFQHGSGNHYRYARPVFPDIFLLEGLMQTALI